MLKIIFPGLPWEAVPKHSCNDVHVINYISRSSLRLFQNLYDLEILYEDAFVRWKEEVNDLQPGKGQALSR